MLITFILVIHTIIALALVGVILIQRSEGGGLGIGGGGGGPAGLMTARGAANLLTRATTILATLFIATSIALAVLAGVSRKPKEIDTSLAKPAVATGAPVQALPVSPDEIPLAK